MDAAQRFKFMFIDAGASLYTFEGALRIFQEAFDQYDYFFQCNRAETLFRERPDISPVDKEITLDKKRPGLRGKKTDNDDFDYYL